MIIAKYTDFHLHFSSSPHITHFLTVVAMKQTNFKQIFVLIQANIACKSKVSYFTNALVQNIFTLVLYFNSTDINCKIRHCSTTIRRNFLETQFGFSYADPLMVQGHQSVATVSNLSNKFVFINRRNWNSEHQEPWYTHSKRVISNYDKS